MRVPAAVYIALGLGITLGATVPGSASAQVPTAESQPRLAVPARGAVIETAAPAPAPAAAAAPADQPAPVSAAPAPSGVTTIPAAGAAPPATSSSSQAMIAADKGGYAVANFTLALNGIVVGSVKGVEGGGATAEVVKEKPGADHISKKHVGNVKYEDISFSAGLDSKPLTDWIAASWKGGVQPKDGSVASLDYDRNVRSERQFFHAYLTETTFPTLDAASKDAGLLTLKISPEYTRTIAGSGAKGSTSLDLKQKAWRPANFRFEMDGLDGSKVTRIESFTVGQHGVETPVGEMRDYQKEPSSLEFPNLKITLAAATAQTWAAWHEDFLVKGNATEDKERNGAIVFLDQSMKNELARVNLFNCGIVRLAPQPVDAGSDRVQRMVAELYCERMELVAAS